MRRFLICLLLAGCSVDLRGVSASGSTLGDGDAAGDGDGDGDTGDDASAPDFDAAEPRDDGGSDPRFDSSVDDAGDDWDASLPSNGYQPSVGQIGSRCTSDSDCGGLLNPGSCAKESDPLLGSATGYCTRSCNANGTGNSCGADAICIESGSSGGTCQRYCRNEEECRLGDGYRCVQHPLLQYGLCWRK